MSLSRGLGSRSGLVGILGVAFILLGALAVFDPYPCLAQTAIVKRNVNLRRGPSSSQAPIRLLVPPEELRVLSLTRLNGYYNVSTNANEVGWAYAAYVEIDEGRPGAIVRRNTHLRPDASSSQPAIRLLTPPEELELLEPNPTNRYYHAKTRTGEQGWVYGPNVDIISVGPSSPPDHALAPFPDAHEPPIPGWTGPVFKLSQDYPAAQPAPGPQPWKQFDFKTQADQYLRAVLTYALEGNVAVDWQGDRNPVRKWYHAPWLHPTANGREFVHGLTRERSSRPRELHPNQTVTVANYAVGLYDPVAGYVIGRVWRDRQDPDPSAARFPEGSVGVKLLFAMATNQQVPYLANSLEWDAYVSSPGSTARTIQKGKLLQVDVAVRDSRADATTGWVFGTFAYDGTVPGPTVWDRLRPVGLMWGNDSTLTPAAFQAGRRALESKILNPVIGGVNLRLGWLGRMNGPVDNPASACLSCHGTAQHVAAQMIPSGSAADTEKMRWFRNIRAGQPFDAGQVSLDYSLQLSVGLRNFFDNRRPPDR